MIIENFTVTLTYEVQCDEKTGEIETRLIKKSIDKSGLNFKSFALISFSKYFCPSFQCLKNDFLTYGTIVQSKCVAETPPNCCNDCI